MGDGRALGDWVFWRKARGRFGSRIERKLGWFGGRGGLMRSGRSDCRRIRRSHALRMGLLRWPMSETENAKKLEDGMLASF